MLHAAPALPVKTRVLRCPDFRSQVSPDISLYPVNDVGAKRIKICRERAKRATMRELGVEMQMDNIGHGWSDSHSRPIQFIANTRNQRCKEEQEEEEED